MPAQNGRERKQGTERRPATWPREAVTGVPMLPLLGQSRALKLALDPCPEIMLGPRTHTSAKVWPVPRP